MLYDEFLQEIGHGLFQAAIVAVCSVIAFTESLITSAVPFIVVQASCDLGLDQQQILWPTAAYTFGLALGSFWFGVLTDIFGRKCSLSATCILIFLGCFVTSFAQCIVMFMAALLFLGFGVGGNHVAMRVFVMDIMAPSSRGSLYLVPETSWAVGHFCAIGSAWLVSFFPSNPTVSYARLHSWRVMFGLSGTLSIITACLVSLFPASPRWLLARGVEDWAYDVLKVMFAVNQSKHEASFPNLPLVPPFNVTVDVRNLRNMCGESCLVVLKKTKVYLGHLLHPPFRTKTLLTCTISLLLFDGLTLLNILVTLNTLNKPPSLLTSSGLCYAVGAVPLYFGNFTEFCVSPPGNGHYLENVYIAALAPFAPFILYFFVDILPRRRILRMFIKLTLDNMSYIVDVTEDLASIAAAGCCFLLKLSSLEQVNSVAGHLLIFFAFIIHPVHHIIILESFPTVLKGTIYGLNQLLSRLMGLILLLYLPAGCPWVFIAAGSAFLGCATCALFLPNLNKKPSVD